MALTTLPYPNMDFTPLDILTADELDHIVANYTAINNATISPSIFSDGSIAMSKVDWSTATNGTSYFKIGRLGICWGTINTNIPHSMDNYWTNVSITFPLTYSVAPTLSCTGVAYKYQDSSPYLLIANTNSVSTTGASVLIERLSFGGSSGLSTSATVNWVAIGLLPEE